MLAMLDAAARGDEIPTRPTPLKMLLPRAPPDVRKTKRASVSSNPRSSLNRNLLADVWLFCEQNGEKLELGRVLRVIELSGLCRTVVTTTKGCYSFEVCTERVIRGKFDKKSLHGAKLTFSQI